jgi:hypothetical protein
MPTLHAKFLILRIIPRSTVIQDVEKGLGYDDGIVSTYILVSEFLSTNR